MFFITLKDTGYTPKFTTNREEAQAWLDEDEKMVVSRLLLAASGGRGIILSSPGGRVPEAPLHTLYVPKKDEYRIHIFRGNIIDMQKKMKKRDAEEVDYQIRNHDRGFIYAREGIVVPQCVSKVAVDTFNMFNLDFGAVDIIYNERHDRAYALEINTAPGLEGATVHSYSHAFIGEK